MINTLTSRISQDSKDSLRVAVAMPLRDKVADRMRMAISEGTFRPGERLRERDVCELLGVSRTSVREALRQLESEGLVLNLPNKGPTVSSIDSTNFENIYETRAVLEGLIGRLFARRAPEKVMERLKAAFERMAEAYAVGVVPDMVAAKSDLYTVLLEGAANDVAAAALRAIHIRAMHLRALSLSQPGRADKSIQEVRRFIELIAKRDEEGAWAAAVEHIRNAGAATLKTLRAKDNEEKPPE